MNLREELLRQTAASSWVPRHAASSRGREVHFEPADGSVVPLQVDGDPAGLLPATFTLEPAALSVIAPALL